MSPWNGTLLALVALMACAPSEQTCPRELFVPEGPLATAAECSEMGLCGVTCTSEVCGDLAEEERFYCEDCSNITGYTNHGLDGYRLELVPGGVHLSCP